SYSWLENNPEFIGFNNPEGCNTGPYGEWEDNSNRFWAAVEMYVLTGNEKYHDDMKSLLSHDFFLAGLGYADVGGFGAVSYLRFAENRDEQIAKRLADTFIYKAKELAEVSDKCGYGAAMTENDYHWGSNMTLLKHGMTFAIADYITGERRFKDYARKQADYLLGVNAMGISYVTGTGEYRCNYPHLRPAHADGVEECIPGMVSGGPNRFPGDPDAKILIPEGTPPMKCYAEDVGCYSLNEITIYLNSPGVFLFGYLS
ncbi:MAG: glycoside hydrolase family 9 protein, partial [Oscillospiraceae bacterium]|nr:glycoside hydrolase family 9 protein [Oscillospiraceae bacterium]